MIKDNGDNKLLPKYKNPPVNEVILGITFNPIIKMKAAHIGLFWNKIRKNFPKCEQAPVIGDINEIIEPETGLPVPRTWLINREDDHLIQLQKNKFLLNWRKREKNYPHYNDISELFFEQLNNFYSFISENDLGSIDIRNYELTYINNILKGEGWDEIKQLGKLLPDIVWREDSNRFLNNPEALIWQSVFTFPDNKGKLVAKIQQGIRNIDSHPLIIFELSAHSINSDKTENEMLEWFNMAHEWIVKGFEDLTSDEIQKTVWEKF